MAEIKSEKVKTKSDKSNLLKKKCAKDAISILKQVCEKFSEEQSKKALLDDASESYLYLQITLKKIPPKKLKRMIKVHLPHSLLTDTTEVCLITGDLEKNNKKAEIEPVVLHYKELLKKHSVTEISEVIPLRQLRTEYKTFESKRQLSGAYDIFLNDRKITECLPRILGKSFYSKRKFPIQINMDTPNLKCQIEKALSETVFPLTCRGNSCTSVVARLSMEDNEILQNILACVNILTDKIPGKWSNVLGIYLKTAKSNAIPIYMSFENPNELKLKAPRNQEKVKAEELSTVPHAEVKVFRDGRIIVQRTPDSEDEGEKEDVDVQPMAKRMKTDEQDNEVESVDEVQEEEHQVVESEPHTDFNADNGKECKKFKVKKTHSKSKRSNIVENEKEADCNISGKIQLKSIVMEDNSQVEETKNFIENSVQKKTRKRKSYMKNEKDSGMNGIDLKVKESKVNSNVSEVDLEVKKGKKALGKKSLDSSINKPRRSKRVFNM